MKRVLCVSSSNRQLAITDIAVVFGYTTEI